MVRVSGIGFVTEAKAQEVSEFWKAKKVYQNVQKALAQTVEGICSNAKLAKDPLVQAPNCEDQWLQELGEKTLKC
eukprot:g26995.t2